MKKPLRLLLFAGGLALAGWLIFRHAGSIGEALGRVGWAGFLLYLLASFPMHALSTWAWRLALPGDGIRVSYWKLLLNRMAGEAGNKITPLASLGGEPVKAYLLARDGVQMRTAIASVAVSKNVMTLAQIAFMFLGIALGCRLRPDRAPVLLALGFFPLLVLAGIATTVFLDARLRRARRAGDTSAAAEGGKLKAALREMAAVWGQVIDFFWENPRRCLLCLVVFFLAWAGGALETWTGALLLGFPLTPALALRLEGLLMAVNFSTFFVPANAGAQEGGFALLGPVVGLTQDQAIALAVLRRCRDVVWIGVGAAYLAGREGRLLLQPATDQETPPAPAGAA